jgi:hypothetical protein
MKQPGYDPDQAPKPEHWLALDEQECVARVRAFHGSMPGADAEAHALVHVVVENQLAAGEPAETRTALERLRSEGLSRHEAIHAIGTIVTKVMFDALQGMSANPDAAEYVRELEQLTAAGWRESQG